MRASKDRYMSYYKYASLSMYTVMSFAEDAQRDVPRKNLIGSRDVSPILISLARQTQHFDV